MKKHYGGLIALVITVMSAPPWAQAWHKKFKIIDLGTLGGDYSYALGVNGHGQVVGARGFLEIPLRALKPASSGIRER